MAGNNNNMCNPIKVKDVGGVMHVILLLHAVINHFAAWMLPCLLHFLALSSLHASTF